MLVAVYVIILGIVFGSFYYVVGTRLVNGESLIKPPSHCTYCNHKLGILDLIPIFSFTCLRGKCRYCHEKLSLQYLLYEILTGILFLLSYLKFQISYEFFISILISSLVVLIFITDFKYMIILDSPLVVTSLLTVVLQFVYFDLKTVGNHILSGAGSFIAMYSIGLLGKILFKKEALGGGDIKFSFVMGLLLGFKYSMLALVFSTFLALPYAVGSMLLNKEHEVPFGPFLVSSVFIIYYFAEKFQYVFLLF